MKNTLGELLQGAAGTAQEVLTELDSSDPPDWGATIATWFINAPGQSIAWRHYALAAVHLRSIKGVRSANITRNGATHEIMLLALDSNRNPRPESPESWSLLLPSNFIGQAIFDSDAVAARVLRDAALAIVRGELWAEPPLSGQRQPWESWLVGQETAV